MRSHSVQVEVPARLYNEFINQFNDNITTEEKREAYREADFRNTATDQKLMEEALIPYFLEELGYSPDAKIGHRGDIIEESDD